MSAAPSWHAHVLLLLPRRVQAALCRVGETALVERVPNLWQVELGVLRMWHRVLLRPETIGTCTRFRPRSTWRARLLHWRALRLPALLLERAVAPWDHTGMLSSATRIRRHLLGAHHDGLQFVYDLQLLSLHPGELDRVREEAAQVVQGSHPRAPYLRDLVVFENYHEELLSAVERFQAGEALASTEELSDPDLTLTGFLDWCARQPPTPAETWQALRRGLYRFPAGLLELAP